ncbi:MAG TPA: endonuclease domain-containing protein [Longimicrobium sp.]|nr:endonuclease domain-containing protein [Longimicrobium sp.]
MRRDSRWRTNPPVQQRARELRRPMTEAEAALWSVLRRNGVEDLHFRRQHAIGRFILDFYCASKRLAIEVDGPVHDEQRDYDEARTGALQRMNIRVLRFRNEGSVVEPVVGYQAHRAGRGA